jgi:hypothetical protein
MVNCKNCGTEVLESAGYCPRCGYEIGRGNTSPRHIESYKNPEYKLLSAITGGLSILLLGVLIYMAAVSITPLVSWSNFFAWFLLGHGALLVMKYFANQMLPIQVRRKHGDLIGGGIIAAIGALCLIGFGNYFIPIAIVGIGIYAISMGILKFYTGNGHSA